MCIHDISLWSDPVSGIKINQFLIPTLPSPLRSYSREQPFFLQLKDYFWVKTPSLYELPYGTKGSGKCLALGSGLGRNGGLTLATLLLILCHPRSQHPSSQPGSDTGVRGGRAGSLWKGCCCHQPRPIWSFCRRSAPPGASHHELLHPREHPEVRRHAFLPQ